MRAAFDDVTSDRSRRELVPIIRGPIELMDHRSQRQACIGCAARDDNLRAFIQSFNDRRRAQISIRALNAIPNRAERLIRIHVAQFDSARDQIIDAIENVVAGHNPNFQFTRQAEFARDFAHNGGTTFDVHSASVRNYSNVAVNARRQNLLHQRNKVARVARVGIARLLLLHDRHRDLGQIVEHQIVDRAAFNLTYRRIGQVAPESLARSDANFLFHSSPESSRLQKYTGNQVRELKRARFNSADSPWFRVSASITANAYPFTALSWLAVVARAVSCSWVDACADASCRRRS